MTFLRGTPVIISDYDCPSANMVACIIGWNAKEGHWKARYLNADRHRSPFCWSPRPTAVADFGMTIEADVIAGQFRAVPFGVCTATYDCRQFQKSRIESARRDADREKFAEAMNSISE